MDTHTIDVDGISIRYADTGGTGTPVVCTHGIGCSLEFWAPQLASLGSDRRVIAWDMPDHGESGPGHGPGDPDSFATSGWAFLDRLGIEQAHLVGNSLGAAVSIRMAGERPQAVASLVSIGGATLGTEVFIGFRLMTLRPLGELMTRPARGAVDRQIEGIFDDPASVDPDLRAAIERNLAREGGQAAFLATLRRMSTIRGQRPSMVEHTHALLRDTGTPILFVHGNQDGVVPARHSVEAAALCADARVELLDRCGHAPQIEQPTTVDALIADHIGTAG